MANPRLERRQQQRATQNPNQVYRYVEPAMTIGSSIVAEPISGLAGIAGTVLPGKPSQGADWVRAVQEKMTFQPRTQEGVGGLQSLGESWLGDFGRGFQQVSQGAGDVAYDVTGSPLVASAFYSAPTAALEALGLKGARAASKSPRTRQIFGGQQAKTADLDKMRAAQELANRGVSKDEIWSQTGWFQDVDGQWKFEIDDSGAALAGRDFGAEIEKALESGDVELAGRLAKERKHYKQPIRESGSLAGVIDHRALYEAYPDAANIGYKPMQNPGVGSRGAYSADADTMIINTGMIPEDIKSTGLHETQHAIQRREGFAVGGSPQPFIAEAASKRADALDKVTDINEQLKYWAGQLDDYAPGSEMHQIARDSYDRLLDRRSAYVTDANIDPLEAGAKQYERLAGEAEARVVQARMNMTPEQRLAEPPWKTLERTEGLKPEDLIVRMEADANTPMQAAAVKEMKKRISQGADDAPAGREMLTRADSKLRFIETEDGKIMMHHPSKGWSDVTDSPAGLNARAKDAELQKFGGDEFAADQARTARLQEMEAAREAERAVQVAEESYKMQHTAPLPSDGNPTGADINDVMPDIYTPRAKDYYGTGAAYDQKAIDVIQDMKANPGKPVKVYRAVPEDVEDINAGDWVTTTREYADDHMAGEDGWHVIEMEVMPDEIATDGNSIHEWGYEPKGSTPIGGMGFDASQYAKGAGMGAGDILNQAQAKAQRAAAKTSENVGLTTEREQVKRTQKK